MAISNKAEIKAYYELNNDTPKQVAERFKIKYRTLSFWIKNENWQKGGAIKELKSEVVQSELLGKESFRVMNAAASALKSKMLNNLSEVSTLDKACLNALLDEASEKILLEAMSVNFIQKKYKSSLSFGKR